MDKINPGNPPLNERIPFEKQVIDGKDYNLAWGEFHKRYIDTLPTNQPYPNTFKEHDRLRDNFFRVNVHKKDFMTWHGGCSGCVAHRYFTLNYCNGCHYKEWVTDNPDYHKMPSKKIED